EVDLERARRAEIGDVDRPGDDLADHVDDADGGGVAEVRDLGGKDVGDGDGRRGGDVDVGEIADGEGERVGSVAVVGNAVGGDALGEVERRRVGGDGEGVAAAGQRKRKTATVGEGRRVVDGARAVGRARVGDGDGVGQGEF